MAIPAYLNPPDFLAAMNAGASAGLGRARITQAADEAAARLSLGYAELGARERMSADENAARREHAADVLRERQSEFGIRQAEIAAQNAEQAGHHREAQRLGSAAQALRERAQTFKEKTPPGARPMNVSPGSQLVDPTTGKVIFNNPASTRLNEPRVTEVWPEKEEVPEQLADSGKRSLLGMDWARKDVPPTPATPATPAKVERRITRAATPAERAQMGLDAPMPSAAQALAPPQAAALPGAPATAPSAGVVMTDPGGHKVRVPQERVDELRSKGYQ